MARFKCTPSNMVKLTVAVVANLFASAALALGVATNYWKKTSTLDVHYGLWEFSLRGTTCPIDDSCVLGTSCMVLDPNTRGLSNCSYFNAVRGLAIIATMIALAATALQFCFAIGRTTRRAWLLNFLSAATAAGAIGVFIDTYGSGDYGYSLIVFMAGAALEFVTTLFAFFGRTPRRPNDAPSYDRNVAIGYSF